MEDNVDHNMSDIYVWQACEETNFNYTIDSGTKS